MYSLPWLFVAAFRRIYILIPRLVVKPTNSNQVVYTIQLPQVSIKRLVEGPEMVRERGVAIQIEGGADLRSDPLDRQFFA
jgi:hypothetical protein